MIYRSYNCIGIIKSFFYKQETVKNYGEAMLRLLFFTGLLILFTGFVTLAGVPRYITVSGTVKDAVTGKGIAFASVSLTGSHIGTVSNLDGVFTLKVPVLSGNTDISISHLGYRRADFSIDEIDVNGRDFLIEPHTVLLKEVVIRPTDARAIVVSALGRIEENYPVVPYRLTGFYRETIRQRREYVSISEAVVDIYQAPYNSKRDMNMFRIIQGRKSGNVKRADTLLVKLQGGPHVSMLLDVAKNPELIMSSETANFYNFDLVDIVKVDEVSNYVISFSPRVIIDYPLYYGKLYISVERHAITMAEFSLDLSDRDKAAQSFILRKPARLRFNPVNTRYLASYKEVDGKYHVNYLRYELEFFADWRRRLFRTGYTIMSEMAITTRTSGNVKRFAPGESLRPTAVLAEQVPVYFDDDFWGEYNYIEPDQSIETAIRRLNRQLDW